MLVSAVAGVDDGDVGFLCRYHGSAFFWVAHGTDICVGGDNTDGVGHAFPFGSRGGSGVGKAYDTSTQPGHGGFKTQPGAGAGLIETGGENLPITGVGVSGGVPFNVVCQVKEPFQLRSRKIQGTH